MESFLSWINKMDTIFNLHNFVITACIVAALVMYFGVAVRENLVEFIKILVHLVLIYVCLKKTPMELTFSEGRKRRARLEDSSNSEENLKTDIKDFSTENSNPVLPEVPESPKKKRRKQKKKRNMYNSKFKSMMDDSSETSSNGDISTKVYTQPDITKIYSPLFLYQQLALDDSTLYDEMEKYVLTKEQLRLNDFPEESPENPGRAILKYRKVEKGSTRRNCARCYSAFDVYSDGRYDSTTLCRYHEKKPISDSLCRPGQGRYPCCNKNFIHEGCRTRYAHVTQECSFDDFEFVKTKHKKHLSKEKARTVFGLDCEMVFTTVGMEVAKVGVVGLNGLTIFESFVLPKSPILDYNTLYSGIRKRDLEGVSVTLEDVQAYLLKLLNKDSILVGHGLENDLKALRLIHNTVVDTSVVFPHEYNKRHKKSLKSLALEFLNKTIQDSKDGHNSIEDSRTCMELMLFKISQDRGKHPLVFEDENKNSLLLNLNYEPQQQPIQYIWQEIPQRIPDAIRHPETLPLRPPTKLSDFPEIMRNPLYNNIIHNNYRKRYYLQGEDIFGGLRNLWKQPLPHNYIY